MKLKDIEKNLKSEHSEKGVPDVYARVKKAPLNKLLDGETPIRAFQKQLVIRLLVIVLLLFTVVGICLGALWVTTPASPSLPQCTVTITVVGDSGVDRYVVRVKNDYDIIGVTAEVLDGVELENPTSEVYPHISDFISPKAGDKVTVYVDSLDSTRSGKVAKRVENDIKNAYGNTPFEIEVLIGVVIECT